MTEPEPTPRRLRAVRLFDDGSAPLESSLQLEIPSDAELPFGLLRLGPRDLASGIAVCEEGAPPAAIVTGVGEDRAFTKNARHQCRDVGVPWTVDPFLFKTALPGYRTARHLQELDYTPGRDEDPYTVDEFDERGFARRISRLVIGAQTDLGAGAAYTGSFLSRDIHDRWLAITAELHSRGIDARDVYGTRAVIATLPLRMSGFLNREDQRLLVRALAARRPNAYLLMLDGLHEDSSAERLVSALRLALFLRATGARVIVARVGDLRCFFLAFGIDGIEYGLGRWLRFARPDYLNQRGGPGPVRPRHEFTSLLRSLPASVAEPVLHSQLVPESVCNCPTCDGLPVDARIAHSTLHDGHHVDQQLRSMRGRPVSERVGALDSDLRSARELWSDLEQADVVSPGRDRYDALRRAIDLAAAAGLMEPERLSEQLDLRLPPDRRG